ncbi:SCP2 sterol-binding domain-containing protein [Actinomadura rupiterrae]|uniref:SCP2 sterol-binding domain-containing protein n=1 Tax=Actinomadura rupiterrae TaxID=559627 RepID=UPI0020A3BB19|nr:SCP2 sterol-binding domain-containing protein [Actinomadura rupiterrae]MCP2340781.1 alkyl sulfatase BDS1-like metallo-beta-lactamase superfamily hydrolase [Actinomadura rupiterrae]
MGVQIPSDADGFKQMLEAVSTPAELRELLHADGVDDKVVAEFVRAAGVDDVLDRIFGLMGGRFVPEKAGDGAGSVQWNVKTPDGPRTYHLDIAGGRATGGRGAPAKPTVTLGVSLISLLRLCTGELNGVTGVMTGKIKISGDLMFGAKMQGWFDYS